MANAFYDKFVGSYLSQAANQVDFDADDIRVVAVDAADYTPDLVNHEFLSDIPSGGRVASAALVGESLSGRVFDANDTTLVGVSGDEFEYVVLYKHTGSDATARLIAIWDTATGLPLVPNGADVIIQWSNGANRIFRL